MTIPAPTFPPHPGPVLPRHLLPSAMDLERTRGLPLGRAAVAVDELRRAGTPEPELWPAVLRLLDDAAGHPDGWCTRSASLHLADGLARHRDVRGRAEPTGRTLLVSYDLRTPELAPWAGWWAPEVIGDRGLTVDRDAPATLEHGGPQLGTVVAAELRPLELDLWVELARGETQDEMLAAAYYGDRSLGTSLRFSDDPRRTRTDGGQVTRQGVTVRHLAFCAEPMRGSRVERATLPATSARSRGAVALLGPHAEVLPGGLASRAAALPDGATVARPDGTITRPAAGRVLRVDGRPVR